MSISAGVVMDPISTITINKDTTFAILLEAQSRGWDLWYMEQGDLFMRDGRSYARMRLLQVNDDQDEWFKFGPERESPLDELHTILMRKDPPFDMEYIYSTYLLDLAEQRGALVVNRPESLRSANEKMFTAWFPQCCAPTLVSRDQDKIVEFLREQEDIILKPLDGMGGNSVFRITKGDLNTNVIIETLSTHGSRQIMAQRFLPEISKGDKRIIMVDGEPIPYALARIPKKGELRGNLAAGGTGEGLPLSDQERWIAEQVGPELRRRGILFAGLDVIGDYLTEINITSPTCVRELDRQFDLNISAKLLDRIEEKIER